MWYFGVPFHLPPPEDEAFGYNVPRDLTNPIVILVAAPEIDVIRRH